VSSVILDNRSDRSTLTPKDLMFQSLNRTQQITPSVNDNSDGMNYTNIEIIDRLVQIKFLDYCLKLSNNLLPRDKQKFNEIVINKHLSIFPQNFINIFSKNFQKRDYVIATGSMLEKGVYGNYRGGQLNVGSYLAELKVLFNFDIIVFIVVFILLLLTIIVIQSFQITTDTEIIFSPVIFVISPQLFWLVGSDASVLLTYFLVRGSWELALLYYILFFFSRKKFLN
tara:strand:+ start:34 stop:711 length:678 start_codon:yes stop_codon:yes gene_type:complete